MTVKCCLHPNTVNTDKGKDQRCPFVSAFCLPSGIFGYTGIGMWTWWTWWTGLTNGEEDDQKNFQERTN